MYGVISRGTYFSASDDVTRLSLVFCWKQQKFMRKVKWSILGGEENMLTVRAMRTGGQGERETRKQHPGEAGEIRALRKFREV